MPSSLKLWIAIFLAISLGAFGLNQLFQAGVSFNNFAHWQKPGSTNDTIAVSGEGKVVAIPDIGLTSLSVESRAKTIVQVQTDNTQKMNEIIAYLKSQDIEKKDIRTTQYNLYPIYNYERDSGKQILDGYQLTQTVEVKIRNLDKVGTILAGAIEKGANQVGQLTFAIDDPEAFQQKARLEAIGKARTKAEAMAKAAGVHLGKVRAFSENVNSPSPYPMMYARDMAVGGAEMKSAPAQIEAGSQEIVVNVSLSFEIE